MRTSKSNAHAGNARGLDTQPASILLVDDTHENLRILTEILDEPGYSVRPVTNGEQALESARLEPPDLILLDIKMPGLSGYDVCERLRDYEATRNIPVIFVSALHEIEEKVKAFELGAVDYIAKPFYAEEVLARVKLHIRMQDLQRRLEDQKTQLERKVVEQERAERELRKYEARLEDLVAHRTQELEQRNAELREKNRALHWSHQALQKAQAAAEAANRAKQEFIMNISHELRTPLNGVLGFAQVLEGGESLTDRQRKAVTVIAESGELLLVIIDDLIALASLESGQLGAQQQEFFLPRFLERLAAMFRVRAEQKNLRLITEFAPELPDIVVSDKRRLRQILLNLLGNAVKFTAEGTITLRVAAEHAPDADSPPLSGEKEPPAARLCFLIQDTGVGIPAEHLEHIFEAFHQVGEKRLAQTEGPGLGLTICQRLVRMLGGELQVQSAPGEGSAFWFELELPTAGTPPERADIPAEDGQGPEPGEPEAAIVPPPPEDLAILSEKAVAGDLQAIHEHAGRLTRQNPQWRRFAEKLVELTETYQPSRIQQFLAQYAGDAETPTKR